MKRKLVVITGANGFVGKNVGKFLAKNNFQVINLVRQGKNKKVHFGKTLISKSLEEDYLSKKILHANALLHFIGRGVQTVDFDYETVNVHLTRNAVDLCKDANIKKIIYISGLGSDKNSTLGYFISKYKAEQEIMNSGLDYTIFRASYIIGKNDPLSKNLRSQIKNKKILIPGSGKYRFQPIFIDDVSRIIFKALSDKKFSKKIVDLVGPEEITFNTFVRRFTKGKKVRLEKINFEEAYRNALHNKGKFGVDDLSIMIGDYVGNHKKLASMAKIRFTRYDEVLESSCLS